MKPEDAVRPKLPPTRVLVASQRPRPAPRGSGNDAATVIGAGLTITGKLESKGEVQIEGEVQGDVHAQHIVIGERARITGPDRGGDCRSWQRTGIDPRQRRNVSFLEPVEGDVFHKSLVIEQGAFFEGKSRRSEAPMSAQSTASGLPPAACYPGGYSLEKSIMPTMRTEGKTCLIEHGTISHSSSRLPFAFWPTGTRPPNSSPDGACARCSWPAAQVGKLRRLDLVADIVSTTLMTRCRSRDRVACAARPSPLTVIASGEGTTS